MDDMKRWSPTADQMAQVAKTCSGTTYFPPRGANMVEWHYPSRRGLRLVAVQRGLVWYAAPFLIR